MAQYIALILGYGVPKNMSQDLNYQMYLRTILNKMFDIKSSDREAEMMIIFCGGCTDMTPPYGRTEANEMKKCFTPLLTRPIFAPLRHRLRMLTERESLSTIESFVNAKRLIKDRRFRPNVLTIFCERTRENRVRILANEVFGELCRNRIHIVSIDFDQSDNRYRDRGFIEDREASALKAERWALQSPENFRKLHGLFAEKIERFRKAGADGHVDVVYEWWKEQMEHVERLGV